MKKMFLLAAVAMSVPLASCGTVLPVAMSPAPLQHTVIDDRAVQYAFYSYDALLSLTDVAIDAGKLPRNSAQALKVRTYLVQLKYWLNAANSAQKAGSLTAYNEAFAEATKAMALAKTAIAEIR
jgi:hypothetical protein